MVVFASYAFDATVGKQAEFQWRDEPAQQSAPDTAAYTKLSPPFGRARGAEWSLRRCPPLKRL